MEEYNVVVPKQCVKHPNKKAKYVCEHDDMYICSKCIVTDHKGHPINEINEDSKTQALMKKSQVLQKKIDASMSETLTFEEELLDVHEQLERAREASLNQLDEKLDYLVEMLRHRIETLQQTVDRHYKKQNLSLKEALKNVERRKTSLERLSEKLNTIMSSHIQTDFKLDRLEEDFIQINRSYDCPFH